MKIKYSKPKVVTEKVFEVKAFGGISLLAQCGMYINSTTWGSGPNRAVNTCKYAVS